MSKINGSKRIGKEAVVSNLIWRFAERCGAQGVTFVVSIVLARMLSPEDYGLIAMVMVITSILNVFVDSGMASALIQKKDTDDVDFSSVFYFNIVFCLLIYAGLFATSPFIAKLYNSSELTNIIRVLGLTIVISGVKNIQISYVSKTMQFKKFFFATLGGTVFAAIIGIFMAYKGFGVWALVVQQVSNTLIDTMILWVTVKWRPKMCFSYERLKGLLKYGWKILTSNLLDTVYNNVRQLVIGIMYSSADLAFYNKGKSFPWLIIENINSSINSVLLPTMSTSQDNNEMLRAMTRRSIKVSTYVMAPMMMGLCFVAEPFVRVLLTEKWLPCVPYMRIFCISYMFYPIHTANLNAILAKGRSDVFLKLETIKKVAGMILLLSSMWFGVMAMAYSLLVSTVISMLINSWPNRKLLGYTFGEQIKDIMPNIVLAVIMGFCARLIEMIGLTGETTLLIQIPLGIIIYIIGSKILKLDSFDYILDILRKKP